MDTKIYKSMMSLEGEAGDIFKCDTIMHEGEPWLVPEWSAVRGGAMQRPTRLVRLLALEHQVLPPNSQFGDFLVKHQVSRAIFYGPTPASHESDVVENPEILIPISRT